LIADYFRQFPSVQRLIDDVHVRVVRDGYIDDIFGRRRHLTVAAQPVPRKSFAQMTPGEQQIVRDVNATKRQAQNFAMQGPAATVTKLAMINCHRRIVSAYPAVRMILTLHDELHFEVPDELVESFAAELPALMCELGLERFGFTVPFRVDVKVGRTWGTMKKWNGCQHESHDAK
jgi:DNA polymerase I